MVARTLSLDRSEAILIDLQEKLKIGGWTATVTGFTFMRDPRKDYLHSDEYVQKELVFPSGNPTRTPRAQILRSEVDGRVTQVCQLLLNSSCSLHVLIIFTALGILGPCPRANKHMPGYFSHRSNCNYTPLLWIPFSVHPKLRSGACLNSILFYKVGAESSPTESSTFEVPVRLHLAVLGDPLLPE